jgi:DNA modification methylase
VEVEFYCNDAREDFLQSESVDLFLVHPPYLNSHTQEYGGDLSKQIHNIQTKQEYLDSIVKSIKSMDKALSKNGNILMIVGNNAMGIRVISALEQRSGLFLEKVLIWNFDDPLSKMPGESSALIIHMTKKISKTVTGQGNYIIDLPWNPETEDVLKYGQLGFVMGTYPLSLAKVLIEDFSLPGDTVADIYGGTGTCAVASIELGRKSIYNDISVEQAQIAKSRINDILELKRTHGR